MKIPIHWNESQLILIQIHKTKPDLKKRKEKYMKINSVRILNPFGEIWFGDTNNDSAIRHSTVRNKNLVFDVDCSPQICSIITVRICFKRGFTLSRAVKYLVKLERKLNDLLNSSIWNFFFFKKIKTRKGANKQSSENRIKSDSNTLIKKSVHNT